MIDWSKINSIEFEKLSFEYMNNQYPNLTWQPTQLTHDDNRDGESIIENPINVTIKYWYESKFSKNINKSIPKSHLDSTLVSCVLDGKVVIIAFITNAYISDDYRRRADIFARQRDNLKIIYINGNEIEAWLSNNPDIEKKYFNENIALTQNFSNYISQSCILQSNDHFGNKYKKVMTIENNQEYILYISYYSTKDHKLALRAMSECVCFPPVENRTYDSSTFLSATVGFNSFYIPIIFDSNTIFPINLELYDKTDIYKFSLNNMSVINMYNPVLVYGSQVSIANDLYLFIKDCSILNSLFYITGEAGTGKTYLLNTIYKNNTNPFSSIIISFTGDKNADLLNCYKIILYSLYGDIWNYINDDKMLGKFSWLESQMIRQLQRNISNQDTATKIINQMAKNTQLIEKNTIQSQIFIDDVHKISDVAEMLLSCFFEWFIKQRFNCKIFVFGRPVITDIISSCLLKCAVCHRNIDNITTQDIEATIKKNFNNISDLYSIIKQYPLPLNALHFLNIICAIHEKEIYLKELNKIEIQISLNRIYKDSNSISCAAFGKQLIAGFENDKIVYCIYKIKTGISLNAIMEFFGSGCLDLVFSLCQQRIIKEASNQLYPYHDIMISAFSTVRIHELDKILEEFVIFSQNHGYLSEYKMFAILISIGRECFWKYREKAGNYRDNLHSNADYYPALEIAVQLNECNQKNIYDYDVNDCKNLFVLANCTKYTDSYQKANIEFEKIENIYKKNHCRTLQGLYLEATTEIINNLIWMLDIKKAKAKLDELSPLLTRMYINNLATDHNSQYAVLNYFNRLMFVKFMTDEGDYTLYVQALTAAQELKLDEYVGFAKMDYAKCLYNDNLSIAYNYMNEALDILLNKNEKRRVLDAKSELLFIGNLENRCISYDDFYDLKDKMEANHYLQSSTKITLKIILLKLLFELSNTDELRDMLSSIITDNVSIESGKRHQAYVYHLYAATYYIDNNMLESYRYTQKCLKFFEDFGDTYKSIHKNNLNLQKNNGLIILSDWNYDLKNNNKFVIDIRIW